MPHYMSKMVDVNFKKAISSAPEKVKKEWCGIITENHVSSALKKKFDLDFRRYTIQITKSNLKPVSR